MTASSRPGFAPPRELPPLPVLHPCEQPGCTVAHGIFGFGHGAGRRWFCVKCREEGERWWEAQR